MTSRRRCFLCLIPLLMLVAAQGAATGVDPQKAREIPARVRQYVADHTIAGAVTLVARHGQVASLEAVGEANLAHHLEMRTDSLFWIASMTKPITATALISLESESNLEVDDPVEKFLPEFRDQLMVAGQTAEGSFRLQRPPRLVTIRDLLTHTSGLSDVSGPGTNATLAELVAGYARQPLQFAPGSRWAYSNAGINTLGRIIEVVSSQAYADFLQQRFFTPLGMKDTTFYPTAAQLKRLAKSYQPSADGHGLEETNIFFLKGGLESHARTAYPAGGLFSTAPDLFRFYQMMLNGGVFEGRRYVPREAVERMTKTQTGDLKTGFTEGMSYGLGWAVIRQPAAVHAMLSAGTFGHGGAYGTQGWIDPKKDLILILMIQRAKLPNADDSVVRRGFQEAAAAALSGP